MGTIIIWISNNLITTISTANRSAKVNTTGQTNDGQYATFELSIIYKINKIII